MAAVTSLHASVDHAVRFETRAATREPTWVKWTIVGISLAFFTLFC
jgi:sulfate transport system permease protein